MGYIICARFFVELCVGYLNSVIKVNLITDIIMDVIESTFADKHRKRIGISCVSQYYNITWRL